MRSFKHVLSEISENTTGGFIDLRARSTIRPLGRVESIEQIEESPVACTGRPVLVKDVAEVRLAPRPSAARPASTASTPSS